MSVLLLHPLGLDHRSTSCLDIGEFRAPDLPGHGIGADKSFKPTRLEDVAEAVATSLTHPTHLIGFSVGGMVAMLIAHLYPERVRSLVLVATASEGSAALEERASGWREPQLDGIIRQTLFRWFGETMRSEIETYGRETLALMNPQTLAAYWSAMARFNARPYLERFSVPTTCVAAVDDVSAPPTALRELAQLIPDAEYTEVPGPHMAMLTHPVELSSAIRDHLLRNAG